MDAVCDALCLEGRVVVGSECVPFVPAIQVSCSMQPRPRRHVDHSITPEQIERIDFAQLE